MLDKLFSIKEAGLYYEIKFLGIKIKFKSLKLAYKQIKELKKRQLSLRSSELFWLGEEKYSINERIWYLSQEFYETVGYYPNIKNPKSFNEKLHWLKLNYYNPAESVCIDKYSAKIYINKILGEGHTVPLLCVYTDVNDIDFKSLPEKFVIKSVFDGGGLGMRVVENNNKLDIDKLKYDLNNMMQKWHSLYYRFLSRGYKNIEPRLIIEEYLPIREGKAIEYKMFCFNGEMKFCLIECDYFGKHPKRAVYDAKFNEMPFSIGNIKRTTIKQKPATYDKMVEWAEILSKDFLHVRVDFYDVNGKIYVGEMSFSSASGFGIFHPREWDYKIGEWLDLDRLPEEYITKRKGG